MTRNSWIVLCLAYVVGLSATNLPIFSSSEAYWHLILFIAVLTGVAGSIAAKNPYFSQINSYKLWLSTGIVAILAIVYFQLRTPQPKSNDISYQTKNASSQLITVTGKVLDEPRLTTSHKVKFWFEAEATEIVNLNRQQKVSGKLYVTLPLLKGTGIYPGQNLSIQGNLYLPKAANNPGGFDFRNYLARQGAFAGLQGFEAFGDRLQAEPVLGWWKLRRRIVGSQLRGLGSPWGQLISSMVLGRKAVDLPAVIRDRFVEGGLAHILAASGFHVSLLLGIVLKATNRLASKSQLIIGLVTLFSYVCLTGLQPSIFRAGLMGSAVLAATAMETKVKPLGSLLLAATIILLVNPLWIGDVGFQLSFLATFGLIVTLPALQTRLDWLPPAIATLVTVPVAASIWVLPLLSYVFNTVATYSLVVNVVATPLVTLISLGGMVSATAALIVPFLGSAIAWLLLYPTLLLNEILKFFTNLPGSTWAIGKISLVALIAIYALFCLVWLHKWWQSRWWLVLLVVTTIIIVPISYERLNLVRVTVLSAKQEQIVVIKDKDKVILINSGSENTAKYTVLNFLTQQGINQIDYGIALDRKSNFNEGWREISARLPIKHFVNSLATDFTVPSKTTLLQPIEEAIATNSVKIAIDEPLSVLKLIIKGKTWLILGDNEPQQQNIERYVRQNNLDRHLPVLLLSGTNLQSQWLEILQPQIAIVSGDRVSENLMRQLEAKKVRLYLTNRNGAIAWTPKLGFETVSEIATRNNFIEIN
ncbi:ComEC/Rec2 family competence protein [Myxosarcina sp. GI1]|uniref:ComEC/Rec2 family competence protein n=1 Tax=Myxosarcina sp. GI1 TaxID=1541065 RepID=UPI00055F14D3|nr:ComEC/Rec2 family competence protein [Myxosarcina sp. GI1]